MNGLIVAERMPRGTAAVHAFEHEAADLHEEFHFARKIIQGLSAAYLLDKLGARSLTDELEDTLARIAGWVAELESQVHGKAARNLLAERMLPVVADLRTAQRAMLRIVSRAKAPSDRDPLALVRRAHDRLERIFDATPLGSTPTSNGCAVEIDHLVSARSN